MYAPNTMNSHVQINKQLINGVPAAHTIMNQTKPYHNTLQGVPHGTTSAARFPVHFGAPNSKPTSAYSLTSEANCYQTYAGFSDGNMHTQVLHHSGVTEIPQTGLKNDFNNTSANSRQGHHSNTFIIPNGQHLNVANGLSHIPRLSGKDPVNSLSTSSASLQQRTYVQATAATSTGINSSASLQAYRPANSHSAATRASSSSSYNQSGLVHIPNQQQQHPGYASRQQTPNMGAVTLSQGQVLVRNQSGQLMLVTAPQAGRSHAVASNSHITTVAPLGGCQVQSMLAASRGTGQSVVTMQSAEASHQQTPPALVAGLASMPRISPLATPPLRPGSTSEVSRQPSAPNAGSTGSVSGKPLHADMTKAENVKKCKNFLSTLIKLAQSQPTTNVQNVKLLIQGLIDGRVEPELFTERLQHELQSSEQPFLVPFLKKSLPFLRHSMSLGHMMIDGIKPPPREVSQKTSEGFSATTPKVCTYPSIAPAPPALAQMSRMISLASPSIIPSTSQTSRMISLPSPSIMPSTSSCRVSVPVQSVMASPAQPVVRPISSKILFPNIPEQHSSAPQQTHIQSLPRTTAPAAHSPAPQQTHIQSLPRTTTPAAHSPVPQQTHIQSLPRTTAPAALSPHISKPVISKPRVKVDNSSTVANHKGKRKFDSLRDVGDDDINDVATMGGVNLSEETKNIMATTNLECIGAQTRSCKEELFLASFPLQKKILAVAKKYGIEEVNPSVISLISHATQERLREMAFKLSTIAEHRVEVYKMDTRYEVNSDTRLKVKFMEELDKGEKKRHEEQEREKLLRAIKSRSKIEDPEQLKLKQKAKELQQAEAEKVRQEEANLTALAAIGPRKKRKLDFLNSSQSEPTGSNGALEKNILGSVVLRPRIKRVNMRDLQFLLECERHTRKSDLLYRTFVK